MPNWSQSFYSFCSDATKTGDKQLLDLLENCKKFEENAELDEPITKNSFAYHVLPYPDEYDREWVCEHWGTKWPESECRIESENDFKSPYGFTIKITTAWCNFNDEWICKLSNKYPNVKIFIMEEDYNDLYDRIYKCFYDGYYVDLSREEITIEDFREYYRENFQDEYIEDEEHWDMVHDWSDLHHLNHDFINDPTEVDYEYVDETFDDMFYDINHHFSSKIDEYHIEPKKNACNKIGEWFLKIKYDPSTKYGYKFANELYDENHSS